MSRIDEKIAIVDFGSQYTQLIARRIRELGVFSEVVPAHRIPPSWDSAVKGVILSGSPYSVHDSEAPSLPAGFWERLKVPLLGVCYGMQRMMHELGGRVAASSHREYGRSRLLITKGDALWAGVPSPTTVWMSHGDSILDVPPDFDVIGRTERIPIAAVRHHDRPWWGVQFHPEVVHTEHGPRMLANFLDAAGCRCQWTPQHFVESAVADIRATVAPDEEVIMALSGGVDSTVAAELIHRAVGDRLHCLFVDTGLLRKDEFEAVMEAYEQMHLPVEGVRASERFLSALAGVADPEKKRKIIGRLFIEEFESYARRYPRARWLGQGTIYPDRIESTSATGGPAKTIKSHHNVGGLPEKMNLRLLEPLQWLFKDEVRRAGEALQIPSAILQRHPFPGPGLAIRILGPVTAEKVALLQQADALFIEALRRHGLYDRIWQAGAVLLPVKSVGVMGDERTYEWVVALRAVHSVDGMTADWYPIPHEVLGEISNEIINRVSGINRVVYDISSKPPATIEWE